MKEFTVKFTTSDEFEGVIERLGYKYQADGDSKLKQLIEKQVAALIGRKFMSNWSIGYKTLRKAKGE